MRTSAAGRAAAAPGAPRCDRRHFLLGGTALAAGMLAPALPGVRLDVTASAERRRRAHLLPDGHLHTRGARIVDRSERRVRFAGVSWYGCETPAMVVGGLDLASLDDICARVVDLGFNMIRLPFSVEMVRSQDGVVDHLAREPSLRGLRPLEIMDRVVDAAGRQGLKVVLDSHRSDASWSLQGNGLWYTPEYTETTWLESWVTLVDRYREVPTVVGCDLRNEPGSPPADPDAPPRLGGAQWGWGGTGRDWAAAAERAGNVILDHNPDLLVCVEGVRDDPAGPWFGGGLRSYWPGGNLCGVDRPGGGRSAPRPLDLRVPDRLVYSVHDYGPDMAPGLPWAQPGDTAATASACRAVWDQAWGHLVRGEVAPVWVGEFGTPNGRRAGEATPPARFADPDPAAPQGTWFAQLVDYIRELGLSWSIWALNGTQSPGPGRSPGEPEWYGVLDPAWSGAASPPMMARLRTIQ
jgi:endoglucanase